MGTGSGVCAVFAAKYARRVVAVDINPAAVRCAGINALLNRPRTQDRCAARRFVRAGARANASTSSCSTRRSCGGTPHDDRDRAWRSNDVAERFAAGLRAHLKPGGSALVLLSTFGDGHAFLRAISRAGFEISVLAERRFVNERLTIFRLVPSNPTSRGMTFATYSAHQSDDHGAPSRARSLSRS